MEGKLHITSACDFQFVYNIERRGTEHLIFLIPQRLGRSHYNAVPCMNAHGIDVFHITHGNAIACAVAHHFILDFLPSRNAAFHQDLPHTGKTKTVFQNAFQFFLIVGDAAAGASQRISRTQYHRIADGLGKDNAVLHRLHHLRSGAGFADLFHGVFKLLPVFRLLDGSRRGSQQSDMMGRQKSGFF